MSKLPALPERHVEIYVAADGEVTLDVRLDHDTVWLSQKQIAELFQVNVRTVNEHLLNVYSAGELEEAPTIRDFRIVRREGTRTVNRDVKHYNLDAILSVGYRVNSKRGTQFRIWATQKLKDYLVKGYALNQRRLNQKGVEIEQVVRLLGRTLRTHQLVHDEGEALLDLVGEYARTWRLLLQYDEDRLPKTPARPTKRMARFTAKQAREVIAGLKSSLKAKGEASDLFGHERDDGIDAILGNLEQSFGGETLYPSVEVRAAHLLYFIIKDHPFSDGNKRIGSFMFLAYLDKNKRLLRADGTPRFNDNALVALALLIAESDPSHKDLMVRLVMGLLDDASDNAA